MSRFINIEAFEKHGDASIHYAYDEDGCLLHAVDTFDIPSADVVEVVRCKDCKWSKPDILLEETIKCERFRIIKGVDGYCEDGERNG